MPSFRTGEVVRLLEERPGLQRVEVDLGDGPERAYVLPQLTGTVAAGDRVVVNTTAVELGLGTGGWHVVHWNLARPPGARRARVTSSRAGTRASRPTSAAPRSISRPSPTSRRSTACPSSRHRCTASSRPSPSRSRRRVPDARVAYVMTDGAGLPIALSDLVATLRARGLVDATVTFGHAFGGDFEAVSVFSALAVARHVAAADVAIVAMGPGIVGTNTRLGFSGLEIGPALDATVALGGVADRRAAGLVRRSARAPRRPVAPQRHRAAARVPGAGPGARPAASVAPRRRACAPISPPRASTGATSSSTSRRSA